LDKQDKKNPLQASLAAGSEEGKTEIENLPQRVSRYSKAKARSREMQAFLKDQFIYQNQYLKLKECGNWLKFHHYYTEGKVRLHQASLCRKHLLCPLCAILRGAKQVHAYTDKLKYVLSQNKALRCSMVTLTTKNGPDLLERFIHHKNSYQKLEQSRRNSRRRGAAVEWGKVLGLVGSYEVTNEGNGWHVHQHIAVLHTEKIWHGLLAKQWYAITGDSNIIDITPFEHPDEPEKDFLEIFKYSLKFSEMSLENNLQAYNILSSRKLIFSAGLMWGVKVPESWMDEQLDPALYPYIELLYKYYDGDGYRLKEEYKVPF